MPITTTEQVTAFQEQVRTAVLSDSFKALKLLTSALPVGRAKYNQTLVLTGRANDIADHEIGNTLSPELLTILRNELRKDILVFTDHLTLADFGPKAETRPELKPGHLLYKVPTVMKLREAYPCIIRIAHQLNQVLAGIAMDESIGLGEVSVSEVMEIEVIDPNAGTDPAFDIILLSDGEQFVDEYSATEWVFNVRPLREGSHDLVLKISVLLTINGKERTKNVVYQRSVSVRAEAVAEKAGFVRLQSASERPTEVEMEMVDAPYSSPPPPVVYPSAPTGSGPPPPPRLSPPPSPSPVPDIPSPRKSRMRFLSAAATVLLLAVVAFWMIPVQNEDTPHPIDPGDGSDPVALPDDSVRSDTLSPVIPWQYRDTL